MTNVSRIAAGRCLPEIMSCIMFRGSWPGCVQNLNLEHLRDPIYLKIQWMEANRLTGRGCAPRVVLATVTPPLPGNPGWSSMSCPLPWGPRNLAAHELYLAPAVHGAVFSVVIAEFAVGARGGCRGPRFSAAPSVVLFVGPF